MAEQWNRRNFLTAAAGVTALLPSLAQAQAQAAQPFLVGFAPEMGGKGSEEKWWHACDECMRMGFRYTETNNGSIRLVEAYADRSEKFKEEMGKRKLTMAGFALGSPMSDPDRREEVIDSNMRVARFLQAVGGSYITHLVSARMNPAAPQEESMTKKNLKDFAAAANELGKRMQQETGVKIALHADRSAVRAGMYDPLMEATDPRYFHAWADVGHMAGGGADPLELIRKYRSRLIGTHLKDWDPDTEGEVGGQRQKGSFVAPGRGIVNFPAIIAFLKETKFTGFNMVELDSQPYPTEEIRDYVVKTLGLRL
jgi:inosose dehydratase